MGQDGRHYIRQKSCGMRCDNISDVLVQWAHSGAPLQFVHRIIYLNKSQGDIYLMVDTARPEDHVSQHSRPTDLRITDMRIANLAGLPMDCSIIRLETNQGLVGYGEVRDWATPNYALQLKPLIVGENPCNVDKIFRKIKQFGFHGRQGGGVCGVEMALMDLAGKAYGVPAYMLA